MGRNQARGWAILSTALRAASPVLYKGSEGGVWLGALWRSILTAIVLAFFLKGKSSRIRPTSWVGFAFTSSLGLGGILLWSSVVILDGAAKATLLVHLAPMWAVVLQRIKGERFTRREIFALGLQMLGLALVIEPSSVLITAVGVMAGVLRAAYLWRLKTTTQSPEEAVATNFAAQLLCLPMAAYACMHFGISPWAASVSQAGWLLAAGLTSGIGHLLVALVSRTLRPHEISGINTLEVPLVMVMAVLLFQEPVTLFRIASALLITIGVLVSANGAGKSK